MFVRGRAVFHDEVDPGFLRDILKPDRARSGRERRNSRDAERNGTR
jgi:hypothetical protein